MNAESTTIRRRQRIGILALACGTTLLGSLAVMGNVQASETFPVNTTGHTYGDIPEALENGQHLDLVLVIGDNGREGYAHRAELDGESFAANAGREEILRALSTRSVPVYLADGVTQVDSFTVDEPQGFFVGPNGERTEFNNAEEYVDLYLAE